MKNFNLKLAYLISRYPAISHTFILREITYLRKYGFDIEVASINSPDRESKDLTKQERLEAAKTYYIKQTSFLRVLMAHIKTSIFQPIKYLQGLVFALCLAKFDLHKLIYSIFYFIEAIILGNWLIANNIKHLHVHFATPAATVGIIAKQIFDLSFSMTVHGPDEFYDVNNYFLKEKISQSDFVCCISAYAQSQLMKLSDIKDWHKFKVIPLGVEPEKFPPKVFQDSPKCFEILCVGRLVSAKGQAILIKAVSELIKEGLPINLSLVGDGPDKKLLEYLVSSQGLSSRITFAGAVNQDKIRDFYNKADIFALSSFAEGVPVVLMEAMAMEIPCISTNIAGIAELIRSEIDGILVPASDIQALKQSIVMLVQNDVLRKTLAETGRKRVLDKYNLHKNIIKLAEVFDSELNNSVDVSEVSQICFKTA
jgi:glycosyltransferase involved in cell wall biosynthesis